MYMEKQHATLPAACFESRRKTAERECEKGQETDIQKLKVYARMH